MDPYDYFADNSNINKKKYDALRAFFYEKRPAEEVAENIGYSLSALYSLTRDFRKQLRKDPDGDIFFKSPSLGRKKRNAPGLDEIIVDLRKQNFSAEEIVGIVNAKGHKISYGYVYNLLRISGFARLPRRSREVKQELKTSKKVKAPEAGNLEIVPERFHSGSTGIFTFLPLIQKYGIDRIIEASDYPETKAINKLSSILCFVALKLSNIKRYSDDDLWCMDRGLGLFAGLNVLPKSAWLSSYSSRVIPSINVSFLQQMHQIWSKHDLLSDTVNMDFTTIPYWGDDSHLENNWSGKRNKALSSMSAVLAQNPDNGIIDYGSCDVRHENSPKVVLEYLDFYKKENNKRQDIRYLIFDSKFSNYENLSKLEDRDIKFITIRRRGKRILEEIKGKKGFKRIRVETGGPKKRTLKVLDEKITLRGYKDEKTGEPKLLRQITITGHGKIKPALIITNDFDLSREEIVRKYSRRWLVEKGISEQIEFFHLNRVSSSMVIKVDFDLTITLLAHNLYRLYAKELGRYSGLTAERIYEKFITNNGSIEINEKEIIVELKKKRDLPQILDIMKGYEGKKFSWLGNKKLVFYPSATS